MPSLSAEKRRGVTVVIPTRNRLDSLKRAVASVQRQVFHDWQLIVVDDASTDGTSDWLGTLNDPRVTIVVLPSHVERSRARNRGLQDTSSRYVLFLDDDDELLPSALDVLSGAIGRHDDAVAAVGIRRDAGARRGRRDFHPRRPRIMSVRASAFLGWVAPPSQTLFRSSAVREVGGWPSGVSRGEDRLMWLSLSTHGRVVFVPRPVVVLEKRPLQIDRRRGRRYDFAQWLAYLDELPHTQWIQDARIIRATRSWNEAMEAYDDGRYWSALRIELRSFAAAPKAFLSPLVRQKVFGMTVLTVLGAIAGRRLLWPIERRVFRSLPS
jgi:glycosyltransferase involved in cell wall biosynthesis